MLNNSGPHKLRGNVVEKALREDGWVKTKQKENIFTTLLLH